MVFLLSLTHYGVYAVGVNNIASALPIMYYLAYVDSKKRLRHVRKRQYVRFLSLNESVNSIGKVDSSSEENR